MKKLFAFIAAVVLVVAMASCGYQGTDSENANTDSVETVVDTTVAAKDSLVQCKGITKRGTQCERMLWWPDTLCFQHVGQAKEAVVE